MKETFASKMTQKHQSLGVDKPKGSKDWLSGTVSGSQENVGNDGRERVLLHFGLFNEALVSGLSVLVGPPPCSHVWLSGLVPALRKWHIM